MSVNEFFTTTGNRGSLANAFATSSRSRTSP